MTDFTDASIGSLCLILMAVCCMGATLAARRTKAPAHVPTISLTARREITIEDIPEHVIEQLLEAHYADVLGDRQKRAQLAKMIRLANAQFALVPSSGR